MMVTPDHPVQDGFRLPDGWSEDECPEQPDEFGAGQRDKPNWTCELAVVVAAAVSARTAAIRENSDQRIQEFQQVT